MPAHRDLVVEQFTKQAVPFSTAPGVRDEEALQLLVEFTGAGPEDTVLDVACGPGLVVCALAAVVRHATGIDVTPAMIERARALAAEKGLANVAWQVGDVLPLPYADGAFSLVVSRFAFHHFPEPRAVLAEMKRVCARSCWRSCERSSPRSTFPRRARRSTSSSRSWRGCSSARSPSRGTRRGSGACSSTRSTTTGSAWGRTGAEIGSCSLTRSRCSWRSRRRRRAAEE